MPAGALCLTAAAEGSKQSLDAEVVGSTWLGANVRKATGHSLALGQTTQHSPCAGATHVVCAPWHTAPENPWAAGCQLHAGGDI